jgi:hypothetical protein
MPLSRFRSALLVCKYELKQQFTEALSRLVQVGTFGEHGITSFSGLNL